MTSILVTGATGFIGQWLCAELTANGHDVHALIRRAEQLEPLRRECERRGGTGSLVSAVLGDLDAPDLGIASAPDVDLIFHLGARFAWNLPVADAQSTNVRGGIAVAELASRVSAKLVIVGGFMSQNERYLRTLGIDPLDPGRADWGRVYAKTGAYEASKLQAFFAMSERADALDVPWIGVHPAGLSGHSETGEIASGQPFTELVDNIRHGRMAAIPGGVDHWLPLTTVDYLAEVLAALADQPWPREKALVVMDPDTPDLAGTIALIAGALGVTGPRRRVPMGLIHAALRLPGVERLAHTSRESLSFIRTERLDAGPTLAFADRAGVKLPSIRAAIECTAIAQARS